MFSWLSDFLLLNRFDWMKTPILSWLDHKLIMSTYYQFSHFKLYHATIYGHSRESRESRELGVSGTGIPGTEPPGISTTLVRMYGSFKKSIYSTTGKVTVLCYVHGIENRHVYFKLLCIQIFYYYFSPLNEYSNVLNRC